MKCLIPAVFLGLFVLSTTTPVLEHKDLYHQHKIDKKFLEKQKDIIRLFRYVNQPCFYKDFIEIAESYSFEEAANSFKSDVLEEFLLIYKEGFLPKQQIFSVFNEEDLRQAKSLFRMFYYAKEFEDFFKLAVWAREYLNPGLFLYSVSVAIVHRPDTFGIVLPPIYEVYPFYFYSAKVIQDASNYKQKYNEHSKEETPIWANYSSEDPLAYYREDVGVSAFYYYYNIYFPSWLSSEESNVFGSRRGEQFYYFYQQFIARYNLERYANGFPATEELDYTIPIHRGFDPVLRYHNGYQFPVRPSFANLKSYFHDFGKKWCRKSNIGYSFSYIEDYERRLRDAIDSGWFEDKEQRNKLDLETLGNLIESNADSKNQRFYGSIEKYARKLLGFSTNFKTGLGLVPSVLEHYETSLRDPAFYKIFERLLRFFYKFKLQLPSYQKDDLYYANAKINCVSFDELTTYFEPFETDLASSVYMTPEEFREDNFELKIKQLRLNHLPFTYKINVSALEDAPALVRVYLGPKVDCSLNSKRLNYVEFDRFIVDLKQGENILKRNSQEIYFSRADRTSLRDLYKMVLGAMDGRSDFLLEEHSSLFGFPRRLNLPKGSREGRDFQFYVFISPYLELKEEDSTKSHNEITSLLEGRALGYPFDRYIEYDSIFKAAPNSYFKDVKIFLKDCKELKEKNFKDNELSTKVYTS